MEPSLDFAATHQELVAVALATLSEEVPLIVGVRKLCGLRRSAREPDHDVFKALVAVESSTHHYLRERLRNKAPNETVEQAAADVTSYVNGRKGEIVCACSEIIRAFA